MNEQSEPPHPAPMVSSEDVGDFTDAPWSDADADAKRFAGCSMETEMMSLQVKIS